MTDPGLRLDKWLFYARFFKTRALAAEQCQKGRIRVDGRAVDKSHFTVRPGQTLSFVQGRRVRVVRVTALADRRGPAPEAQGLYEDLTPDHTPIAQPQP